MFDESVLELIPSGSAAWTGTVVVALVIVVVADVWSVTAMFLS